MYVFAAETPVKYEHDSMDLPGIFTKQKCQIGLTSRDKALVTPTEALSRFPQKYF